MKITGLLNPKLSESQSCVVICFVVYLGRGIVNWVSILVSSRISFRVRYRAPQVRSLIKEVVRLYRSMPLPLKLRNRGGVNRDRQFRLTASLFNAQYIRHIRTHVFFALSVAVARIH